MSGREVTLERSVEGVLTLGLASASLLLLLGLVRGDARVLQGGVLLLLATPVFRVVLVTVGLFRQRDLLFGGLSAFVLAVLALSAFLAFRS